ncbi:unnamed protein product [Cyclocybe aegerita]|uniref:Uncharacterized protein n=1 Tax=Cyclocybe aegerita TaxID=1973307 RepID=A0A8S0WWW5_CYCAE|nr:unnamed protein product [Cyclocybe aegerita]
MSETIHDCGSTSIPLRLPLELERDIFEIAAYKDLGSAYHFLLVAKRVYQWIEPMVYRVLLRFNARLGRKSRPYPLLYQFEEPRQEPSPRLKQVSAYTTHLLLQDICADVAISILKLYNNLEDLALWAISGPYRPLARTLTTLKLQRLSISLHFLLLQDSSFKFDPTLFPHLTHLEIVDAAGELDRVWSKLHLLPRLSHLALSTPFFDIISDIRNAVDTLLHDSLTLKFLILCSTLEFDFGREDPRVVLFDASRLSIDDWEHGARGGRDLWTIAEGLQRERQQSENARC